VQPWAEWFYKSKAWEECRLAFLTSKFWICERCGGAASIAHHKIWLTPENIHEPSVTLGWDNLEALCQDCHNKEHHSSPGTADGLRFDEDGNLVRQYPSPPG
jgi:5-methylcytosine-specific restriction protein A